MKSKKGTFSTFLAIIMTSIIIVLNIFMSASNIRSREILITNSMVSYQDLLLSDFNSGLYERYGIFGTPIDNEYTESFYGTVYGFPEVKNYKVTGINELSGDILKKSISEFSKARFPLFLAFDTYNRFAGKSGVLSKNEVKVNSDSNKSKYNKEKLTIEEKEEEEKINYMEIIKIISQIDKDLYSQSSNEDEFLFEDFENLNDALKLANDSNEFLFESQVVKDLKTNLTFTENTLNDMSSFIDLLLDPDIPDFYEHIIFEHYIQKMFSCKTNFILKDGNKIFSVNLRNYRLDDFNHQDKLEIEKIIFGYENSKNNELLAAMSIRSIRTLLHIISYITDSTKNTQIKSTAVVLCALTAILSAGTILVSTQTMEVVLILVLSASMAAKDYTDLTDGKAVKLFPMKVDINMETYYKDYLFLMQSMISQEIKLNRVEEIIKNNTGLKNKVVYTGVKISCSFRNTNYFSKGFYYENFENDN